MNDESIGLPWLFGMNILLLLSSTVICFGLVLLEARYGVILVSAQFQYLDMLVSFTSVMCGISL